MRDYGRNQAYQGVLTRLRTNVAGATAALMAAAMIPTIILAGSAIDVTRLYVTKVRLQQACDAGVLAGRKFMADSGSSTLDANADTQAKKFFGNNIKQGWMGITALSFTPTKTADNQVTATASATVPMTLMASFGHTDQTLNATCEARYDVADADIMFVLDTTGSMSCAPDASASCSGAPVAYTRSDGALDYKTTEVSNSKMQALRDAVLLFYDTMAANADPSTHIRYGFVPYTSMVNVGKLLPSSAIVADNWDYQTRQYLGDANSGTATSATTNGITNAACTALGSRTPATGYAQTAEFPGTNINFDSPTNGGSTGPRNDVSYWSAVKKTPVWTATSGGLGNCTVTTQTVVPNYRYGKVNVPLASYVAGTAVAAPGTWQGTTSTWRGCIEERDTSSDATFSQASLPADLDPDKPADTKSTKWRPFWPELAYFHGSRAWNGTYDTTQEGYGWGTPYYAARGYSTCVKQAQRLATMTRNQVSTYVNTDFVAIGGTYHDVGMIWGTRMLSPTGPFASDTGAWPGRGSPNRHIIFMTDGNMSPNANLYGLYGQEVYDRRVTDDGSTNQTARHNARFTAVCAAAKARNITVWMIAFGKGGSLSAEMNACASPGKAFYVETGAALQDKFKEIANQIAKLRLSK